MLRHSFLLGILLIDLRLQAQENYEIQVYGSKTMTKGHTMVELHSNFTLSGTRDMSPDGLLPTHHQQHETVEITHGWTQWFETGFYFFNSLGGDGRTSYEGSHIRPRFAVPENWKWPVGVSLSAEFGFQKQPYSPNSCTLEIRPIIDKTWKKWYVSLNPVLDKSFAGPDENRGLIFSPNVKASYNIAKVIALGIEYYGTTGPFFNYDSFQQQDHQLFIVADLTAFPKWELNAGVGYGVPQTADKLIIKIITGRRF